MELDCVVCVLEHGEGRQEQVSRARVVVNGHSVCGQHLEMVLRPEWGGRFYRPSPGSGVDTP